MRETEPEPLASVTAVALCPPLRNVPYVVVKFSTVPAETGVPPLSFNVAVIFEKLTPSEGILSGVAVRVIVAAGGIPVPPVNSRVVAWETLPASPLIWAVPAIFPAMIEVETEPVSSGVFTV